MPSAYKETLAQALRQGAITPEEVTEIVSRYNNAARALLFVRSYSDEGCHHGCSANTCSVAGQARMYEANEILSRNPSRKSLALDIAQGQNTTGR